jgi:hypothetical protein
VKALSLRLSLHKVDQALRQSKLVHNRRISGPGS